MEQEITDFSDYYWEITNEALKLGYTISQVRIFHSDILDAFHEGKSIEQCVEEVF